MNKKSIPVESEDFWLDDEEPFIKKRQASRPRRTRQPCSPRGSRTARELYRSVNTLMEALRHHIHPNPVSRPRGRRVTKCYLYLMVHQYEQRFKIGISVDPLMRLDQLSDAGMIDLQESLRIGLPSRERAFEIERALHALLSHSRIRLDPVTPSSPPVPTRHPRERMNGGTEWFLMDSFLVAIQMLYALSDAGQGTGPGGGALAVHNLQGLPYVPQRLLDAQAVRHLERVRHDIQHMRLVCQLLETLTSLYPVSCVWLKRSCRAPGRSTPPGHAASEPGHAEGRGLDIQLNVHLHELHIYGLLGRWDVDSLQLLDLLREPRTWRIGSGAHGLDLLVSLDHVSDPRQVGTGLKLTFASTLKWQRSPAGASLQKLWALLCIHLHQRSTSQQPATTAGGAA